MNLSNTIIILNSPPNSGKDTIAKAISERTGASHSEFKHHLYQCTATLFNVPIEHLRTIATDRDTKEELTPLLELPALQFRKLKEIIGGRVLGDDEGLCWMLSPREALIYTSECVFKPAMGKDYFGKIAADNIDMDVGAVFSDGGFNEELEPILEQHGEKNVFVVQFSREGTSFDGDSRNYLTVPDGVPKLITRNDGTIDEIVNDILDWIKYEREVQQETFGAC